MNGIMTLKDILGENTTADDRIELHCGAGSALVQATDGTWVLIPIHIKCRCTTTDIRKLPI